MRALLLGVLVALFGCGTITATTADAPPDPPDAASIEVAPEAGAEVGTPVVDAGSDLGGAVEAGAPEAGREAGQPLPACRNPVVPLSWSVPCAGTDHCATECRDQLAHPFAGCSVGGTDCVSECGGCP